MSSNVPPSRVGAGTATRPVMTRPTGPILVRGPVPARGSAAQPALGLGPSSSMRENYGTMGVDGYYTHVARTYRNPHFAAIQQCLATLLDQIALVAGQPSDDSRWPSDSAPEPVPLRVRAWRVLDLAAGSGEATIALEAWISARSRAPAANSNAAIARRNATAAAVTPILARAGAPTVDACDPYTAPAYADRVGRDECRPWSFEDISDGCLEDLPVYDVVVCSFALHLVDPPSKLYGVLTSLARRAKYLVILSPHKKPVVDEKMGWDTVLDVYTGGAGNARVHGRVLQSRLVEYEDDVGAAQGDPGLE
ncbi:hypothetical protein AMAG_16754 [Allomyces macrogynus ATCC 38327]|uniref:Methyltransferase domain-containing protein n=1 Tax=Allomyces macrogynus (strain ATCC 38327) TaxID=578462 RepID=A0A0L0TBY6_ALLM3|nr:hypothetical protein AMAG_16754 [Allomyces macrogynus ATCC 38327]|eukprot:KNE72267.1 hypothetical protein AMAG_16754 [Allomyces macrogynus ATCC 38327]